MNASFVTYFPRTAAYYPEIPTEVTVRILMRGRDGKHKSRWIRENMPRHIRSTDRGTYVSPESLKYYAIYARK